MMSAQCASSVAPTMSACVGATDCGEDGMELTVTCDSTYPVQRIGVDVRGYINICALWGIENDSPVCLRVESVSHLE